MLDQTAPELSTFFRQQDATMGVFYPTDYIMATFATYSHAKEAIESLREAGLGNGQAIVATGSEVLEYFGQFREDTGLWGKATRSLSRFLGAEALNADQAIENAKEGAGFVAAYAQNEEEALRIGRLIQPFVPTSADWYLTGGIRSLI